MCFVYKIDTANKIHFERLIMKKFITSTLALAITFMIGLTACVTPPDSLPSSDQTTSQQTSAETFSQPVIEYPSSTESINSSEISSDVSEIISSVAQSSKPSSAPPSSAPQSSKPNKAPQSSKPSSVPQSSKPSSAPPSSKPSSAPETPKPPVVNHEEMRAVWISFLEFDTFAGSSENDFRNKIASYYDNSIARDVNTVLVQVRPHGDSMYDSAYYPWSKHASGKAGTGVSYDPLAIMVNEARARGLSVHAWINPYRTMTDSEFAGVPDSFPTKQWYNSGNRSDYMVKNSDGRWWLKPGNSEVVSLITNGAHEIMTRYNVDGIHIDDYFYGSDPSNYGDSKQAAKANTTTLVKSLYNTVKSVNSSAKFGVSPLGGFLQKNSVPNSDMNYLSTDLALWCSQDGYIDYVLPQIYWDYNHKTQPFTMTLNKWENFVTANSVALYIGIAPSGLPAQTIKSQIADIKASNRASGYALYRYTYILGL